MMNRQEARAVLTLMSVRNRRGQPLCWLCNTKVGAHMHEMVNRAQTVGNAAAREASFDPHLCALLCPECHDTAPRRSVETQLWLSIYGVWGLGDLKRGKSAVDAALTRLNRMTRFPVMVILPEVG